MKFFNYIKNENKTANDTHIENKVSPYKTILTELKNTEYNVNQEYNDQFKYQAKEVGLNHPTQEAFVKLKDNGDVQIIADSNTGINLNNEHKTINLYGRGININSEVLDIKTEHLLLNGYKLNPLLYELCNLDFGVDNLSDLKLDATVRKWVYNNNYIAGGYYEERYIKITPFLPINEDSTMETILDKIGGD